MSIIHQCFECIRYWGDMGDDKGKTCYAFPNGIPEDILSEEFAHLKKHPSQDNNVLFLSMYGEDKKPSYLEQ